jgi:hypothetical protein
VVEFFKILGEQNVPEEKVPVHLIEVATHFAQTREALAALEPDDPATRDIVERADAAMKAGRLDEADLLAMEAEQAEIAAARKTRQSRGKPKKLRISVCCTRRRIAGCAAISQ